MKRCFSVLRYIAVLVAALCCAALLACDTQAATNDPAPHRDAQNYAAKKGICVSRYGAGTKQNGDRINDLNSDWWYNWGVKPYNDYIDTDFVPMIWGTGQMTQENLGYVKENYESGEFTHLLTFNEPDLSVQADMTVDEALSYWDDLEEIGIPLSSPAVSYYSAETGNVWLDDFMEKATAQNKRVDFIALHLYQSFYSANVVRALKETLDALYEKYKLPVWLTEFGAIDIIARDSHANAVSASCTEANAIKYITETTNMLEQCGYVHRYAWFLDNFNETGDRRAWEAPYTSLYYDDDTLARTGEAYRDVATNVPLVLETSTLPRAKRGTEYDFSLAVCGGEGNYTFTASGVPQGLTLTKAGKLYGTPGTGGVYTVTVTVTDEGKSGRRQTLTHKFALTIGN